MYSALWFFFHLCQNNRITKEAQILPIRNNKYNELKEDWKMSNLLQLLQTCSFTHGILMLMEINPYILISWLG